MLGVAPLPPCSRKLLDETVKTFAVFRSWLHRLDGEDNCMLSVPVSTSDHHYSRWQSGVICQEVSTGAFTLLCLVLQTSLEVCSSSFFCWLLSCPRVCLLDISCLLDVTLRSSARVCCCHRDSHGMWSLISGVCTVLDRFFWVRLGVLNKVLRHVALRVAPTIVDYDSTNFLKHYFVVSCLFVHIRASHLAIASSGEASICLCVDSFPCQVGFVNGNPSGSWSKIRSGKPLWKSGSSSAMNLLKDQALLRSLCSILFAPK